MSPARFSGFAVRHFLRHQESTMQTYNEAAAFLGHKIDRPLTGRATRLIRRDETTIVVRYQATDVVTYHADGRVVATSGGWRTPTTKDRINTYSPLHVAQAKGLWYVRRGGGVEGWTDAPMFEDGVTWWPNGTVTGTSERKGAEAAKRRLDRMVRAYIKGYCASVAAARKLDDPSGGDCWGCHFMRGTGPGQPVEGLFPIGKGVMGNSHYLDHFEEQYYVPSLAWRTVQRCGNPAFVWAILKKDAEIGRTDLLRRELTAFFRVLKPFLMEELGRDVTPATGKGRTVAHA